MFFSCRMSCGIYLAQIEPEEKTIALKSHKTSEFPAHEKRGIEFPPLLGKSRKR